MNKCRKGRMVWTRKDDSEDWQKQVYESISQAKKANGLNSHTVLHDPKNPVREVPAE